MFVMSSVLTKVLIPCFGIMTLSILSHGEFTPKFKLHVSTSQERGASADVVVMLDFLIQVTLYGD